MMKKLLSLAFACVSVALVPASATAMPVGTTFNASLDFGDANGVVEQSVGTWTFLPSFPADSYNYGLSACRYRVAWKNDATLSKTTNIFLDELQPVGENDCDTNQASFITTAFVLAYGAANYGFDPTQQRKAVNLVIVSESSEGDDDLHGLVVVGGVPYSLELSGGKYSMPGYTP
jgi:hypothetical protein